MGRRYPGDAFANPLFHLGAAIIIAAAAAAATFAVFEVFLWWYLRHESNEGGSENQEEMWTVGLVGLKSEGWVGMKWEFIWTWPSHPPTIGALMGTGGAEWKSRSYSLIYLFSLLIRWNKINFGGWDQIKWSYSWELRLRRSVQTDQDFVALNNANCNSLFLLCVNTIFLLDLHDKDFLEGFKYN